MTYRHFTERGEGFQELTPEMEIAALKEKIAAFEKANGLMRESLYAVKPLVEEAKKAATILGQVSAFQHFSMVDAALKASGAARDIAAAQEAFWQAKQL